jgi:DNA-binding XRE family transcriptional regulator
MEASCMLPPLPVVLELLGKPVRRLRTQTTDYSQDGLAGPVGRHGTCIGLVERGKANPSLKTLYGIANALGVSLAELFILAESKAKGAVLESPPLRRVAEPSGRKPRVKKGRK